MRKLNLLRIAGSVAATVTLVCIGVAAPASAANPPPLPSGYGFDGNAHIIVGGGSDTTWKAMLGIQNLWNTAPGCINTPPNPLPNPVNLNTCTVTPLPDTLGNVDHDTMANAMPTGSSAGIAALNQAVAGATQPVCYSGAANPSVSDPTPCSSGVGPTVDFARSSRAAKRTGGACSGGDELVCNTFWGFAQDGVEVTVFNSRNTIQSDTTGLTQADLVNIYNCTYTQWSQVPDLGIAPGSAQDGPIVAWGMNNQSGTYATFASFLGIDPDTAKAGCAQKLTDGTFLFENDVKPMIEDVANNGMTYQGTPVPAGLSTSNTSPANPANWIWWSSFGVLDAFPYTAGETVSGTTVTSAAAPINGILPSHSKILGNTYPIGRTLWHVTKKADADCPKAPNPQNPGVACNFPGTTGPTLPSGTGNDLPMLGGSNGKSGAVMELSRFLCRQTSSQEPVDPFTGTNYFTEIGGVLTNVGFSRVPTTLRSSGSSCDVVS